jgi:hypothetical protein
MCVGALCPKLISFVFVLDFNSDEDVPRHEAFS